MNIKNIPGLAIGTSKFNGAQHSVVFTLTRDLFTQSTKQLYGIVGDIKAPPSLPGANSQNSVCFFCTRKFQRLFSSARPLTLPTTTSILWATRAEGGQGFNASTLGDLPALTRCDETSLLWKTCQPSTHQTQG